MPFATHRSVLVIDAGTTSLRTALVDTKGRLSGLYQTPCAPLTPAPGISEFDPVSLAKKALKAARWTLSGAQEPPVAIGIANQRCSTLLWRRSNGEPLGPGLGWADLRTAGQCLDLQSRNLRLAPNQTATKAAHLIAAAAAEGVDASDLCVGTLDSWLVWHLTEGAEHVTDASNAAISGLCQPADGSPVWNLDLAAELGIPPACLPRIVDSSGELGRASALEGSPPICGLIGDQQSSLIGSGCVRPGDAKITFGTAGMLDMNLGEGWNPGSKESIGGTNPGGSYPIAAWKRHGRTTWGLEAMMFGAGSCVDWFCGLSGLLDTSRESHALASSGEGGEGGEGGKDGAGITFAPLLDGLGAPDWDFGARGAIFGIDTAAKPAHLLRALLTGVAQRGVDLIEAVEADSGMTISEVRVDGGMSANPTFLQALADAGRRTVIAAPEVECTTLGAAFLAGTGIGLWSDLSETADLREPRGIVPPKAELDRGQWRRCLERCKEWHPEFSAISF